jgi:hypothetical protein
MMYIFSLSWLWLLIVYPFIIGIIFGISNGIPSILRLLTLNLFGINWVNCVLHSVAGAIGVIQISRFYIKNPPELVFGDEAVFFLAGMWRVAPFKTIFLALPFIGLVLSLIWSSTIAPLYIKLMFDKEQ